MGKVSGISDKSCVYLKLWEPVTFMSQKTGIPRCGCKCGPNGEPVVCEFFEDQEACIEYEPRGTIKRKLIKG